MSSLSFLKLIICIFSFFFLSLARGFFIFAGFVKEPAFDYVDFLY